MPFDASNLKGTNIFVTGGVGFIGAERSCRSCKTSLSEIDFGFFLM